MEKQLIDPSLIGRHRATLSTWNIIGKKLFTVSAAPVDLAWSDKIKNATETRLIKPIMKYMIESIEIVSATLRVLPDNSTLVIELNENPDLQYQVKPLEFANVTLDKIKEAIEYNKEKERGGKAPIFFNDCEMLTKQVNKLNQLEKEKAGTIAQELLDQRKALEELIKIQINESDRYYEELSNVNS